MPRSVFDIHNGPFHPDDEGSEWAGAAAAREQALASSPGIARLAVRSDGDNHAFTSLAREEAAAVAMKYCNREWYFNFLLIMSFVRLRSHRGL
jgi:hypothetical protein